MDKESILYQLVYMPKNHHQLDLSMSDLFKKSGYTNAVDIIQKGDISEFLHSHIDAIEIWSNYARDQRCVPGWYWRESKQEKGKYEVHYVSQEKDEIRFESRDIFQVVSFFIEREIEYLKQTQVNP